MDFWWRLAWIPLAAAPYAWLLTVIRYAGPFACAAHHLSPLANCARLGCVLLVPVFLFANPFPSYASLVYARILNTDRAWWFAGAPVMLWLYLPYAVLCYLVPLVALRSPSANHDPAHRRTTVAGGRLVVLMGVGLIVIVTVIWAAHQSGPLAAITKSQRLVLFSADLVMLFLVALAVILLGRVIVGFEVFTERPLPRRGFFRQWRRTVILIAAFATAVAFVYRIQLRPIYSLMLATALAATMFALVSWRMFAEHEEFLTLLRPFVVSTHLRERLLSGREGSADIRALFEALCRDVLDAQHACLILDSANGSAPQRIGFRWSEGAKVVRTLNLSDERGQAQTLLARPQGRRGRLRCRGN